MLRNAVTAAVEAEVRRRAAVLEEAKRKWRADLAEERRSEGDSEDAHELVAVAAGERPRRRRVARSGGLL